MKGGKATQSPGGQDYPERLSPPEYGNSPDCSCLEASKDEEKSMQDNARNP